jgi:hypothetical protein
MIGQVPKRLFSPRDKKISLMLLYAIGVGVSYPLLTHGIEKRFNERTEKMAKALHESFGKTEGDNFKKKLTHKPKNLSVIIKIE